MKNIFKKTGIALSVSMILGTSSAWAETIEVDNEVSTFNSTSVDLTKTVDVNKNLDISGEVAIKGLIQVDSNAMAVIDNKQINYNNRVSTGEVEDPAFEATTTDISGNSGNIGINAAAGLYNQQDNAAAISSINNPDQAAPPDYLGSADAEIFTNQNLVGTGVESEEFDVDLIGSAFNATTGLIDGNSGNIGINVSAGVSNLQKNSLAIAVGDSGLSEATSATLQETSGLSTQVTAVADGFGNVAASTYTASLGTVSNNAGNIGVNLSSGSNNLQANSLSLAVVP